MNQPFHSHQWKDAEGRPAGGASYGTGFAISWQNGPLGRGEDRVAPNGAFVETLLSVVKDRIEFYESTEFACDANKEALSHIMAALNALNARTKDREARDVEGTHAQ